MTGARIIHWVAKISALATILTTAGCGHVKGVFENVVSKPEDLDARDVKAALAAHDGARLQKMCSEHGARCYQGEEAACAAQQQLAVEQLAGADCDTAEKTVQAGGLKGSGAVTSASLKMAKCGRWDTMFVRLIHREADKDSDGGPEALEELAKQGFDVEKEFMAFLARHADQPLAFEFGNYTARHVTGWMQKNRPADHCEALVPFATKMGASPQFALYDYFTATKCRSAAKMVSEGLASDSSTVRQGACDALAVIGDMSYVGKLQLLASSDPESSVRSVDRGNDRVYVKVYPVRDACNAAVNKLTLRAQK